MIGLKKELNESSPPFPTGIYNYDGRNIPPSEIINIAPGEGPIPISSTSEPNWEAPSFPKDNSTRKTL